MKKALQTGEFIVSKTQMAIDLKMVSYDLWGTMAHVLMLYRQEIISEKQIKLIVRSLLEIKEEMEAGLFAIDPQRGAQLTLEAEIVKKAGDAGYSVHTGRSRNDQVMVTEVLYLREKSLEILELINVVCLSLVSLADEHKQTIMPGYTHMQPAKVTTFGQWALAYANSLLRAGKTLKYYFETFNYSPLGACESYGTSWMLDREYAAGLLGFEKVWDVPQDVIGSRGIVQLGYLTGLRDISLITSKIAEDLLLFTTFEYNIVSLGDEVAQRMHSITGSSVMAQKRNPDALELIRSVTSQIFGFSSIVANLLSALPMGYNRDSREAKEYADLGFSKMSEVLKTLQKVLTTLVVNKERMRELVKINYSLTTDLADYISQASGVGYRLIYKIVGQVVDEAINSGKLLTEISADEIKEKAIALGINLQITDAEMQEAIDPLKVISKRKHIGGSSEERMGESMERAVLEIESLESWVSLQKKVIQDAKEKTFALAKKIPDKPE